MSSIESLEKVAPIKPIDPRRLREQEARPTSPRQDDLRKKNQSAPGADSDGASHVDEFA